MPPTPCPLGQGRGWNPSGRARPQQEPAQPGLGCPTARGDPFRDREGTARAAGDPTVTEITRGTVKLQLNFFYTTTELVPGCRPACPPALHPLPGSAPRWCRRQSTATAARRGGPGDSAPQLSSTSPQAAPSRGTALSPLWRSRSCHPQKGVWEGGGTHRRGWRRASSRRWQRRRVPPAVVLLTGSPKRPPAPEGRGCPGSVKTPVQATLAQHALQLTPAARTIFQAKGSSPAAQRPRGGRRRPRGTRGGPGSTHGCPVSPRGPVLAG